MYSRACMVQQCHRKSVCLVFQRANILNENGTICDFFSFFGNRFQVGLIAVAHSFHSSTSPNIKNHILEFKTRHSKR